MPDSRPHLITKPPGAHREASLHEDAHHILADSSLTDEPIRVLKQGDTFALFDQYGDIRPAPSGEQGLYHDGTRFLSRLVLELEGARPFFLSSTIRDDNDQLTVALTNPDLCRDGRVYLPLGSLHLGLKKFLWNGACHQELRIENHGSQFAEAAIAIQFAADFADIYEIRGLKRKARGEDLEAEVGDGRVALRYLGLDGVVRRTLLHFSPRPTELRAASARFNIELLPRQAVALYLAIACPGSGRRQAALPRAHLQRRAVPVFRHRSSRSGATRDGGAVRAGLVFRVGHSIPGRLRIALQSHGLSQPRRLAARQRLDRRGTLALRHDVWHFAELLGRVSGRVKTQHTGAYRASACPPLAGSDR
jgi:glycogen debranching enzyme